jgi:hypothetical protein
MKTGSFWTMTIVIARAYGGEPLRRFALKSGKYCVYLANPENLASVESGDSSPVGFPNEDVFLFDSMAYDDLVSEWTSQSATNPRSWQRLKPYRI